MILEGTSRLEADVLSKEPVGEGLGTKQGGRLEESSFHRDKVSTPLTSNLFDSV